MMTDEVRELHGQLSLVTEQLLDLTSQVFSRDQIIAAKEKDLEALRNHLLELEEQHTADVLGAQDEIGELRRLLEDGGDQEALQRSLEERTREAQRLRLENRSQAQRHEQLQETFDIFQGELRGLKTLLAQSISRADEATLNQRALYDQLQAERASHADTLAESRRLTQQLDALRSAAPDPPQPPLQQTPLVADRPPLQFGNEEALMRLTAENASLLERLRQSDEVVQEQLRMASEFEAALEQLPLLTEENERLKQQMGKLQSDDCSKVPLWMEENQRLREQIDALQNTRLQIRAPETTDTSLMIELRQGQAEQRQKLEAELAALQQRLDASLQEQQLLQASGAEMTSQWRARGAEADSLRSERDQALSDLHNALRQTQEALLACDQASSQLVELTNGSESLAAQLQEALAANHVISHEKNSHLELIQRLQQEQRLLNESLQLTRSQTQESALLDHGRMADELAQMLEANGALRSQVAQLEGTEADLRRELEGLGRRLEEAPDVEQLRSQMSEQSSELAKWQADAAKWQAEAAKKEIG
ncbi:MAG: hypothetical protein Q8P67_05040, partial [archaeon]|nr:hypothetical protein [archaeon]